MIHSEKNDTHEKSFHFFLFLRAKTNTEKQDGGLAAPEGGVRGGPSTLERAFAVVVGSGRTGLVLAVSVVAAFGSAGAGAGSRAGAARVGRIGSRNWIARQARRAGRIFLGRAREKRFDPAEKTTGRVEAV